jgi:hypothetical protein
MVGYRRGGIWLSDDVKGQQEASGKAADSSFVTWFEKGLLVRRGGTLRAGTRRGRTRWLGARRA